jgi:Domain of unknown function (DUF4440)
MTRRSFQVALTAALAALCHSAHADEATGAALQSAERHPVRAGPVATQQLFDEITEQDRRLFELVFDRCDAGELAPMLADDFEFYHDKFGRIASSPGEFVESVRSGCEAQARGTNIRARREPVEGTMAVYALKDFGAIQTGSHRFFGIEPGKPDVLRETGKLFHLWKLQDGKWKLARVFSYDHRPAE